ncbi:MAG: hypothetical protein LBU14_06485 [Candidatus Peribacteria bacterium]|nr:hypothetical protein [Candidatus Peribacteria bacterium]
MSKNDLSDFGFTSSTFLVESHFIVNFFSTIFSCLGHSKSIFLTTKTSSF